MQGHANDFVSVSEHCDDCILFLYKGNSHREVSVLCAGRHLLWADVVYVRYFLFDIAGVLVVATIYLMLVKKLKWKQTLMQAVPLGILAVPLIAMQLVNMRMTPRFSFLWTDFVPLAWYRTGETSLANVVDNLDLFKILLVDSDLLRHSAFLDYGTMYYFSIPLVIYGPAYLSPQRSVMSSITLTIPIMMAGRYIYRLRMTIMYIMIS